MAGPGSSTPRTAFAFRDFRFLWAAQLFRGLVVWMHGVSLPWLMLQAGGSPFDVGLAGAVQFLPSVFLSPAAGAASDGWNKQRTLLATQGLVAATTLILLAATAAAPSRLAVYGAAIALGFIGAIDNPVRHALVGQLVPGRLVINAVALNASIFNLSRVAGPALAGGLIAGFGVPATLGLTVVASLAGVGLMAGIRGGSVVTAAADRPPIGQVFREGLRHVASSEVMPTILLSLCASVAVIGAVGAVLPSFARSTMAVGPEGLGVMLAAIGIGSLVAAIVLSIAPIAPPLGASLVASMLLALSAAAIALVPPFPVVVAILVIHGLLSMVATTVLNGQLQQATRDAFRGRVMSLYVAVYALATAVGSALGGLLADLGGPPVAFALVGVGGCLAAAGLAVASRRARAGRQRARDAGVEPDRPTRS